MENEGSESSASKDSVEGEITPGFFSGTCRQLIDDVDSGWKYFWKNRGFDPPPDLYSDNQIFSGNGFSCNEEVTFKKSKQKETERAAGIQKADREFFGR
jgi:hypothetical protein